MDKLVKDNLNIIASGEVDVPVTYSTLSAGNFEDSIGVPESLTSDYRMKIYWSQSSIDGVSNKTNLITEMYFYHRYEWNGSVKANGESFIDIDGNRKLLLEDEDVSGVPGDYYIMSHIVEVPSSATNITILGRCDIGESLDIPIWHGVEGRSNIFLNNPLTPLSSPTIVSVSGKYEPGQQILVSWSGATGNIASYDIEYNQYIPDNGWQGWTSIGSSTSLNILHSIVSISSQKLKYRVRSRNPSSASAWKECSEHVYHYGIKVNNNGFSYGTLSVWNGSSWTPGITRVWNGSNWIFTFNN